MWSAVADHAKPRVVFSSPKNVVTILNEEFENDKTGEKVQGLTIIVDGKPVTYKIQ